MNKFFIFAVGAAIGSAVTWRIVKTKYERIANEEIASVKEVFANREKTQKSVEEVAEENIVERIARLAGGKSEEVSEYDSYVKDLGYSEDVKKMDMPYVIPPDEFGDVDYTLISLNYYADGVLTDDWDNPIDDVDDVVGLESLTHFGEYEEDSVYVRNDRYKCDYEILLDERNFSDVINKKLHQTEEE